MNKTENFILKAIEIHGNKYDYNKSNYEKANIKLTITCPIHGDFEQSPMAHIGQKQGCPICGKINKKTNKKTTEQFIQECNLKWNFKYDYKKTVYSNKNEKIIFECPEHGIQSQTAKQHLKNGCQICSGRGLTKYSREDFIKKANLVHNNYYDYSKINLTSINSKINIICPLHGEFQQKASNHIHLKNGCPKCKGGIKIDTNQFIEKAMEIHGNKFDYSNTAYQKSHDKIDVICKKHGEFKQLAYMHLNSKICCPACVAESTSSIAEQEIFDFIKCNYTKEIAKNTRDILNYREIDIFIPDLNLGIEFNGNYYHCEAIVGKNYHFNKTNLSEKKGIKLIHIFEHEWNEKKEIVKSRILSNISANEKLAARKTKVFEISTEEKNNFLDKTHIQGRDNSSIYIGLKYNDELVACMTFGKSRFSKKFDYELIRYSSKLNLNVIGGAGKLLNYFTNNYKGSLISYADRRWSNGNLYKKLGFSLSHITKPGYFYYNIKKKTVHNRLNFQKHKMKKMNHYNKDLTEYEIMKLNGYDRIWDAGNLCFVLT